MENAVAPTRGKALRVLALVAAVIALLTVASWEVDGSADAAEPPVDVVYVARAFEFADALAGSVVASLNNVPILLVPGGASDEVPQAVRDELTRLQPGAIVIFGGPVAVSQAVENELKTFTAGPVTRVFGQTRIETAEAISKILPSKSADADLLDGLDSTAFLTATGKAADADKLDGLDSTAFLTATGKAADAELLDGLDSTAFLAADSRGVAVAGVDVAADGTVADWFNLAGGQPTVTKPVTGRYDITIPGRSFNVNTNLTAVVTPVGSIPHVATTSSVSGNVIVFTFDMAGAAEDARFQLVVWDSSATG